MPRRRDQLFPHSVSSSHPLFLVCHICSMGPYRVFWGPLFIVFVWKLTIFCARVFSEICQNFIIYGYKLAILTSSLEMVAKRLSIFFLNVPLILNFWRVTKSFQPTQFVGKTKMNSYILAGIFPVLSRANLRHSQTTSLIACINKF